MVGIAALAGCSATQHVAKTVTGQARSIAGHGTSAPSPASVLTHAPTCGAKKPGGHYVGLSVSGFPPDATKLDATKQATHITPGIVSYYIGIDTVVRTSTVQSLCSQGALPLVEIDSDKISLSKIAGGAEDSVLTQDALKLGTLQIPVAVDFDHEFNGPWFDWGYTNSKPKDFIAAWRHIVSIFRSNGATNVIWIWDPNVKSRQTTPDLKAWYPGNSYVTWVGLDGYFYGHWDTFDSVFEPTMRQIRSFSDRPFLIVETGANPASGRVRAIRSLFQGAQKVPDLLGLVWFDYDKYTNHNWLINNDSAALAAFHAKAVEYQK